MSYRASSLFCLVFGLLLAGCQQQTEPETVIRPVLVVQPQVGASHNQSFPGEVRARLEPELAFRIAGKVSQRLVDVGARVKKGQALARLDEQDMQLQLQSAQAQVNAAQANVTLVKAERERYLKLKQRQLASQSHFENADNQYKTALAALQQAQAQHAVAKNQASYSTLYAPADGIISFAKVEVGQVVAAGQTVMVLAADGEREVLIGLPEQSVEQFQIGDSMQVELWHQPEQRYSGSIREISPAADGRSRTFAARISISGLSATAEIGQSARVYSEKNTVQSLQLPLTAVTAEQQQSYVWRIAVNPHNNQQLVTEQVPVQVAAFAEDHVLLQAGLAADDWVVSAGAHLLQPGQLVKAVDLDNRPVQLGKQE